MRVAGLLFWIGLLSGCVAEPLDPDPPTDQEQETGPCAGIDEPPVLPGGTLQPEEVADFCTAPCVDVSSQLWVSALGLESLDGLSCLRRVMGNLVIRPDEALLDASGLSTLEVVEGNLDVWNTGSLSTLELPRLTSVGGRLELGLIDPPEVQAPPVDFDAPRLTSVGGRLAVQHVQLADYSGFGALETAGEVFLFGNATMTTFEGFPQLTDAGELFHVLGHETMTEFIDPPQLTDVRRIMVSSNDRLTELVGFDGIDALDGLTIAGNQALETIRGFASLVRAREGFGLRENASLESVEAFGVLERVGSLTIEGADQLSDLSFLSTVREVLGDLRLEGTAEDPRSVAGLSSLEAVGGDVTLWWVSDAVFPPTGVQTIGGSLELRWLDALRDLGGLSGLESIGGDLTVQDVDGVGFEFGGLESLESVGGDLTVRGVPGMESPLGFGALTSVGGSISITETGATALVQVFPALQTLGQWFIVEDNEFLTELNDCPQLTSLQYLKVNLNPALLSFDGFGQVIDVPAGDGVFMEQGVDIRANEALTSITALSSMEFAASVQLVALPSLSDISGLASLEAVEPGVPYPGLGLAVEGTALQSLDDLASLTTVGLDLDISGNPVLVDVLGLDSVTQVLGRVDIKDNTSLPQTNAQALIDAIGESNISGQISMGGNDG